MHGMHGHGSRPHLCLYDGCERAVPGHGFPRRYNLLDHMRRVHDHVAGAVEAPAGDTKPEKKTRKRKAADGTSSAERGAHKKSPGSPHPSTKDAAYPPASRSQTSSLPATTHASIESQTLPAFQQPRLPAVSPPQVLRPFNSSPTFSADFQSTVASLMSNLASIKGPLDDDGLQFVSQDWAKLWAIVKDAKDARTA